MANKVIKNIPSSVRQRLLNKSKERREDFNYSLTRYALERLLFRVGRSEYSRQFILKGASLFFVWGGNVHRPTMDMDFLSTVVSEPTRLEEIFKEICNISCEEDGILFSSDSVKANEIRENNIYGGLRVMITAYLDNARISLQVDVGFGDSVTPPPLLAKYPTILELSAPEIKVYQKETMVAEKFEAMVTLGMANSRMKDFYDIWALANNLEFRGSVLSLAIKKTFERRKIGPLASTPTCFNSQFYENTMKQTQWKAFINKMDLKNEAPPLSTVVRTIASFLMPPTLAVATNKSFELNWPPKGPWKKA